MYVLGICKEAHYSERSTPPRLGPQLESPQGPFTHRADGWSWLSAETSAGLTQDTDTDTIQHDCGHFFSQQADSEFLYGTSGLHIWMLEEKGIEVPAS